MQLAHLIPHLDAEINRLQKARDLLALVPASLFTFFTAPEKFTVTAALASDAAAKTHQSDALSMAAAAAPEAVAHNTVVTQSAATATGDKTVPATVRTTVTAEQTQQAATARVRRVHAATGELRPGRRRRLMGLDTALRGPVPAGPVVISAEQVRKSQAAKAEQAVRAAEARKAGADLVSTFGWRSRPSDMQSVDALLQRLISIGEDSASPINAGEFARSGDLLGARLASKVD